MDIYIIVLTVWLGLLILWTGWLIWESYRFHQRNMALCRDQAKWVARVERHNREHL